MKNLDWGATTFTLFLNFSVDLGSIVNLNYTPVIQSLEGLFHVWSKRHLTPLGKIAVIKTLALSKLNHLFLSIPSPGKDIFKKIETLFYKFIWNGKPDKVKRTILTKQCCDGGLNMIELNNFDCALKITWIRRIYSSCHTPWLKVAEHYLGSIKKLLMLGSSYASYLSKQTNNNFWAQTLNYWSRLIASIPINNTNDALSDSLWNNPKVSKLQFFLQNWFNKGIVSIGDLIYESGDFLSQNIMKKTYNIKTNFLEYHRVTTCVNIYMAKLKEKCTRHQKPLLPNQIKVLQKSKKGSKDFYRILNKDDPGNLFSNYSFWEEALHINISKDKWNLIFRICFKTIKNNDIIWMQYRVLYRILGTNDYLFKIKRRIDGICNFCKQKNETIIHLLVECVFVRRFWSEVSTLIKSKTGLNLPVNACSIILGDLSKSVSHFPVNVIYLTAKFFIFKISRSTGILSVGNFCEYLNRIYLEQEYVAKLEFKHGKFTNTWSSFIALFSC